MRKGKSVDLQISRYILTLYPYFIVGWECEKMGFLLKSRIQTEMTTGCGVRVESGEQGLLGANECTWGPAHWCASVENAKNCGEGAVQHCIDRGKFSEQDLAKINSGNSVHPRHGSGDDLR